MALAQDFLQGQQAQEDEMMQQAQQQQLDQMVQGQQAQQSQQRSNNFFDQSAAPSESLDAISQGTGSLVRTDLPGRATSPLEMLQVGQESYTRREEYMTQLSKLARDAGNIQDSDRYSRQATEFRRRSKMTGTRALAMQREALADQSLIWSNVRDQRSLDNAIAVAKLRGYSTDDIEQMSGGVYNADAASYIKQKSAAITADKDFLDISSMTMDDETRFMGDLETNRQRQADDRQKMALEAQEREKVAQGAITELQKQRRTVTGKRAKSEAEYVEKLEKYSPNKIMAEYGKFFQDEAPNREAQIAQVETYNPELASRMRDNLEAMKDPETFAQVQFGVPFNRDEKSNTEMASERAREAFRALPSMDILEREWQDFRTNMPTDEDLEQIRRDNPQEFAYLNNMLNKARTIDDYAKSKYGVGLKGKTVDPNTNQIVDPVAEGLMTLSGEVTLHTPVGDVEGTAITPAQIQELAIESQLPIEDILERLGIDSALKGKVRELIGLGNENEFIY